MKKDPQIDNASFRDPSGWVFRYQGRILRWINPSYRENFDFLVSSGLYQKLVDDGLLITHRELKLIPAFKGAYKILEPQKIDFISYPYEWGFSQLKEAAKLTLKIQKLALSFGMSLKDASPFNIQFIAGRPILIDTLSFEKFQNKSWIAYRQFCQQFLNPLILMSKVDAGLNRLLSVYLDGIPPDLVAKMLPLWSKLNPGLFIHVQMHSKLQNVGMENVTTQSFSKNSTMGLTESLEDVISRLKLRGGSVWSEYNPSSDSYSKRSYETKKKIVVDFYSRSGAKTVWDLGANTGEFSRILARRGAKVVSFDSDPYSVEENFHQSGDLDILPLLVDWANPTPRLGWGNSERQSIIDRGGADCILALALIHHLSIGANIPFDKIAGLFSKLCRSLIIEFIPKEDKQVKKMLSLREDIFQDYNKDGFEDAFGKYFKIATERRIRDSSRIIYLLIK